MRNILFILKLLRNPSKGMWIADRLTRSEFLVALAYEAAGEKPSRRALKALMWAVYRKNGASLIPFPLRDKLYRLRGLRVGQ